VIPMLLWGLLAAPTPPTDPIPVVVSTDCGVGVDDEWTLAHLALSPAIDLRGVVTTHAPNLPAPTAQSSAKAAREVLGKLLPSRPPVVAGSDQPLVDERTPRRGPGVRYLLGHAEGHTSERRLTVVMIGAATDVASALLIDPTWADRVTIVAMAFDAWPDGGDGWNVRNDPAAWRVVLESRVPLVVADVAVTRRHLLMSPDKSRDLLASRSPGGRYLSDLLSNWFDRNAEMAASLTGSRDSWPIFDEATTAYLLGFARTEQRPRPRLRDDLTFDHEAARGTITWITAVDADRLWADLAQRLSRVK
jgi:purine nucleosidase